MFKFNPFSSNKNEVIGSKIEANEAESAKEAAPLDLPTESKAEKEKSINESLDNLREAINIQKELGGKVSPETVFEMTGMQPNELLSYLNGREISIDEAELSEIMEPIEEALNGMDEVGEDPSRFRRFANNKVTRAAFVAAMIFLKFAPNAKAANADHSIKDKDVVKKEWSQDKKIEPTDGGDSHTYKTTEKDFGSTEKIYDTENPNINFEESRDISKIELTNYFITDSDKIGESSEHAIADQFKAFLHTITPDNVKDILKSDFTIYGSSDERHTSNWGGSNENLTSARIAAIDNILTSVLHDYHFEGLDDNSVKDIKAKTFTHSMPTHSTEGLENGVTYITDLTNPDTGHNYTQAEVDHMKVSDNAKYMKLLDSCRNINFSAKIEHHNDIEKIKGMPPSIEHETPFKPVIGKLAEYKNITLLFDNSPSMANSYKYIADAVHDQVKDTNHNIHFGSFSDKLESFEKCNTPDDVGKHVESMSHSGSSSEHSFSSAINALEKIENPQAGEKSILLVMTDESFQDVSMDNIKHLQNLSNEKNVEVKFMYGSDLKGLVKEIKLTDLEKGYDNTIKNIYQSHYDAKVKLLNTQSEHLKAMFENKKANFERGSSVVTEKDVNDAKMNYEAKASELQKLKSDWNSGDATKLFQNETLKNVKMGGRVINSEFTIQVAGEEMGETVTKLKNSYI